MFTPRYIKHSKLLLRHAQKYLRYKHDLLSIAAREELTGEIARLREALKKRDHERIKAEADTLKHDFAVYPGRNYKAGEVIARGAIDTGDQVFVDKFSYNFVKPHRGDVFVFRTNNIPGIPGDVEMGQPFYIKRLAGLPGDTLRISTPDLFSNGKLAQQFGFKRVMAAQDGYRGYWN